MNAMTWWDHKTESVWSQPWGRAIAGSLKGTELVPRKTWREAHPDTLALNLKAHGGRRGGFYRATFHPAYVIGVALGDDATAFPYRLAAEAGILNDTVGTRPVVLHVDPERQSIHVYLRQVDERVLTFLPEDGVVQDPETASTWRMDTGLAIDGSLQGQALRTVPYIPAFPEAWRDFYPHSRWYEGDS